MPSPAEFSPRSPVSLSVIIVSLLLIIPQHIAFSQDYIKDNITRKNELMSGLSQHAGLSPQDAARNMTLPDGFKVIASAGEPDIQQPIAMTIDDRGRLWVAEGYSYPIRRPDNEAKDRILIFEDVDHDGIFDKRKVFIEKLNLVSGIEVGFGGVWVGAAPYFMFIPDSNNDDIPDAAPQILLDGWHYEDTHETLNSFIWGPDGWLYGCHGVFTHSLVGKPGTPDNQRTPLNAAIWRYHPIRHQFEVFAHGTSNPWGVDFNDEGQTFLTCCVIPHLFHVIQGARYERQAGTHFNPSTYEDIKTIAVHRHWIGNQWSNPDRSKSDEAGGGHAHAGAMVYLGGLWPEKYRNQIFMNNIHGARINMDLLSRQGSGYVGNYAPDFLKANDSWSQILYLRYGPDGNVYMIDWYDRNQCHHGKVEGHDRGNGRIFKVIYNNNQTEHPPAQGLRSLSDIELINLQLHQNDWWVRTARRVLHERYAQKPLSPAARQQLLEIAQKNPDHTRRLRALWSLHVTGSISQEELNSFLQDKNEYVRAWTIQLASEQQKISEQTLSTLCALAEKDHSPVIKLYLFSALQRLSYEQVLNIFAALSKDHQFSLENDHNLRLMYWYALEKHLSQNPESIISTYHLQDLKIIEFIARRMTEIGMLSKPLGFVDSTSDNKNIEQLKLHILRGILEGAKGRKELKKPPQWDTVSKVFTQAPTEETRQLARRLGVLFRDESAINELRQELINNNTDLTARKNSLNTLVSIEDKEILPILQNLLDEPSLRIEALTALSNFDSQDITTKILKLYPSLNINEKRAALNTLASRKQSSLALLNNTGTTPSAVIKPEELTAELIRQLSLHKDDTLNKLISEKWGAVRTSPEERLKQISDLKKFVENNKSKPDLAHGRAIFMKTCQQCHTLFNQGGNIGPELTGSNRANLDYILSNMIDPSAVMSRDYIPQIIVTNSGRTLTGIIKEQNEFSITLVNQQEKITIPREDILQQKASEQSMMPDNLLKPYSETQIRDLIKYLEVPRQHWVLATKDTAPNFYNNLNLDTWKTTAKDQLKQQTNQLLISPLTGKPASMESDFLLEDFILTFELSPLPADAKFTLSFNGDTQPVEFEFMAINSTLRANNNSHPLEFKWTADQPTPISIQRKQGVITCTINNKQIIPTPLQNTQRLRLSLQADSPTSSKPITLSNLKLETP